MKCKYIAVLACGLVAVQASAQQPAAFKTQQEQLSYAIGVETARNFRRQGVELDVDFLNKGLKDGASGDKLLISEREFRATITSMQNDLMRKAKIARGTPAEANRIKGEAFLAQNKTKDGVQTLPSGLQYKILTRGDGKKPADADTVECHYRGTLLDGVEYCDSRSGQPATFKVKEAIVPGWAQALPLMPVGSKWRLFVPPQLAYGSKGVGRDIGPDETLIFDLELLAVK